MNSTVNYAIFLFIILPHFVSCDPKEPQSETIILSDTIPVKTIADPSIPGNFSPETRLRFDSTGIDSFLIKYPLLKGYTGDLRKFYRNRNYSYAWYDNDGLIEQSGDLYYRIVNIGSEGVPANIPYLDAYKLIMESMDSMVNVSAPNTEIELMMTAQYFNYARNVWVGISEKESRQLEWFLPRKKLNYEQLLDSMFISISTNQKIQEPVHSQYHLLRNYLKRFREIEKNNTWIMIKADKKKYQPGDSSPAITAIRKKLFLAGDLPDDNGSALFDDSLKLGVLHFQSRYGLTEDGIAGPAVLREMNTPLSKRIQQIIVNMERARWINPNPPGNFLLVNIPQFKLSVIENDSIQWTSNVVVGKEMHKTVIFRGDLKHVVFSPYWNVPPGILKNEVLPAIKRNPDYLRKNNMEWYGNTVRQRPGPDNPLGLVKFLFPNSYNIYLHDSPSRALFEQQKRTFSHGCIRVAEARKLAIYLLRNDSTWTEARIDKAMNMGKEQYVTLQKTIPVNIVYFTAWVDRSGRINFRDDVYKRDSRVMEMIFQKSNKGGQ